MCVPVSVRACVPVSVRVCARVSVSVCVRVCVCVCAALLEIYKGSNSQARKGRWREGEARGEDQTVSRGRSELLDFPR